MAMVGFTADRRNDRTHKIINTITPRMQKSIREAWFGLGRDLNKEANKEIKRKPKAGRVYFIRVRGTRRRRHVASAPGESHANLSGRLRRSISWKVHGHDKMDFGYGFSTTASNRAPNYDIFVEDGTPNMDPRPSIENAVRKIQRTTSDHFQKAMLKQFERV